MEGILTDSSNKEEVGEANAERKLKGLHRYIIGNPKKGKKMETHNIHIFSSTFAVGNQNWLKASHKGQNIQRIR